MRSLIKRARQQAAAMQEDDRGIMAEVRLIGAGLVMMLIITLVLTEVYNAVDIPDSSPFSEIVATLEGTGVAAMTLLVVGFLVVAASAIMRFFGTGFGGGR
jgi:hypothetical protein